MNAEKYVKKEAKANLSGNWPIAVFSTMMLVFVLTVSLLMIMLGYTVLGDVESIGEGLKSSPVAAVIFVVFHLAAVVAIIALSPIYNGFVRIFSGIASGKKVDPEDLIYFFEDKSRYKNAVRFMTGIIMKSVGVLILSEIVGAVIMVVSESDAMFLVGIIFAVFGLIDTFCFVHRYAFSVMIFSTEDCSPSEAVSLGAKIAKGNVGKLIRLSVSFIPWMLLMFFVVPFVYICPYMTCAYFVSVKYLIQQYRGEFDEAPSFKPAGGFIPNTPSNTMRNSIKQVPPITEERSRASHFPILNKAVAVPQEEKAAEESSKEERTEAVTGETSGEISVETVTAEASGESSVEVVKTADSEEG